LGRSTAAADVAGTSIPGVLSASVRRSLARMSN